MNCPIFLKLGWVVMAARATEPPPVLPPSLPPGLSREGISVLSTDIPTENPFPPGTMALVLDTPTGSTTDGGFGLPEPQDFYSCSVRDLRDCGPSAFVLDLNPNPGTSGAFIRHPKVFSYPDFDPFAFVWPGVLALGRAPSATPGQRSQLVLAGTSLLDFSTGVSAPGKILPDAPVGNPEPDPYLEILLSPKRYQTGRPVTFAPPGDTLVGGVDPEENMPEPAISVLAALAALFLASGRSRLPVADGFPPDPGTRRA